MTDGKRLVQLDRLRDDGMVRTSLAQREASGLSQFCLVHEVSAYDAQAKIQHAADIRHPSLNRTFAARGRRVIEAVTPGETLDLVLARQQAQGHMGIPAGFAALIMTQVAHGVAALHARQCVHGAVGMGTVLVTYQAGVKLLEPALGGLHPAATELDDVQAMGELLWRLLTGLDWTDPEVPPPDIPPVLFVVTRRVLSGGVDRVNRADEFAEALEFFSANAPQRTQAPAEMATWMRGLLSDRADLWRTVLRASKDGPAGGETAKTLISLLRSTATAAALQRSRRPSGMPPPRVSQPLPQIPSVSTLPPESAPPPAIAEAPVAGEPEEIAISESLSGFLFDDLPRASVELPPEPFFPTPDAEPEPEPEPAESVVIQPKPEPVIPPPPSGFPADGFEPRLFAEDDRAAAPPAASLADILGDDAPGVPGGDRDSAPMLEVARVVDGVVADSYVLQAGARLRGPVIFRMRADHAEVELSAHATGTLHRHLEARPLGPGKHRFELGERVVVQVPGEEFRARVDHAARSAGKATGVRRPWALYATCLAGAVGAHVLLFLGVFFIQSLGIQLTVNEVDETERFASLQPPSKLPEKEKAPPPPPKPKPKPKPKPAKVEPVDPTEAAPELPKPVQERLVRRRAKAKNTTDALMAALKNPAEDAKGPGDVTKVLSNLDAVGRSTNSALDVAGELGAMPGNDVRIARPEELAGQDLNARAAARQVAPVAARPKSGKVRGKVKSVRALTKVRGQVDRAAVRAAIDRRIGRIQQCYERALNKRPSLSGKITAEWTVSSAGRPQNARVKVSTLGDPAVASCILGVIRKIRFPKPQGGDHYVVSYPFIFSPVR